MMIRTTFVAALLAATFTLATPASADATVYRARAGTYRPSYPVTNYSHHMPGWDWRRTYPWSPYNYGRNPYNPIVLPPYYYYAPPYPTPYVYPPYYSSSSHTTPAYSSAGVPAAPKLNLPQPPAPPAIPPVVIGGTRAR